MTINTGNFSNIKPSVSISVVHDLEKTGMVYNELAGILDSLVALETIALSAEMNTISQSGWGHYREMLENSIDEINDALQDHVRVLKGILE